MAMITEQDKREIALALRGYCPKCHTEKVYPSALSLTMKKKCGNCGLDFSQNDNADGPAFFIMAVLCFIIAPSAIAVEFTLEPALWVHVILWTFLTFILSALGLKPLNSLFLRQQYRHRPHSFDHASNK